MNAPDKEPTEPTTGPAEAKRLAITLIGAHRSQKEGDVT
jgi:hypothetical protein